ncbi:MAG TPA: methyltransferase domain-containing protein [Tepidisphaeraceae bacterium]|nr:methyltransferase domain-containing protein [Tepidisphaeraceae bacterium]
MSNPTAHPLSCQPASRLFGHDRGTPIDRFYIENFLRSNSDQIRGRVLETGDASYTRGFGSDVHQSDVLHATAGNRNATIIGDLATGEGIPESAFDCIILTQVLPFIFDVRAAVATCHRALKPGGVVLATVPGISQISRYDMDRWGDFWRFTTRSAARLFEEAFSSGEVEIESFGNVAVATHFLQGLALEEIDPEELAARDPDYQLIITIKAALRNPGRRAAPALP